MDTCETMTHTKDTATAVRTWLEEVVIGLKLCPFAAAPWKAGEIRIYVSDVTDPEDAVKAALDEALALIHPGDDDDDEGPRTRTTLVCFPNTLQDFETFLDVATTLEDILAQAGAEGHLLVATFHPDYLFDGEDEAALSHYTNRSPVPILHLLLESDVSDAVDSHPDIESVPADNVARLNALGVTALRDIWRTFSEKTP